jgi:hypothetical protein
LSKLLSFLLSKNSNNKGLLRKSGDMQFVNQSEIMRVFLNLFYKNDVVVVLYNCPKHCEEIPKLQILKRDNWGAWWWATHNDTVIIKFESVPKAEDWVFSISRKAQAKWELFNKTVLIRNETGVVKLKTDNSGELNEG